MKRIAGTNVLKNGFTLIELIVVIAIIGILATVGVSSYANVLKSARDTKRIADMKELLGAIKRFQIENGRGPTEVGYCQSSIGNAGVACPPPTPTYEWERNATWTDLVGGGYLEALPIDPLNDTTYYYWYEPNNPPPNNGGWIRARLERTNAFYFLYWSGP